MDKNAERRRREEEERARRRETLTRPSSSAGSGSSAAPAGSSYTSGTAVRIGGSDFERAREQFRARTGAKEPSGGITLASEKKNYVEGTLHPLVRRQLTDLGTRGEKLYNDTANYVNSADTSRDQWDYRSYIEQVNSYMDELRSTKAKFGDNSTASDYLAALEKDFGNLSNALYGQKDLLSQIPTGVSYGTPGRAPTYEEARQNWRTARSEAQMDNKGDWSALVADAPVYGPTLPEESESNKSSAKEKTDEVETKLSGLKADALRRIEMNTTDKSVISAARRERARMSNEKLLEGLPEGASYAIEMAGAGTLRQPTSISAGLVDTAALLAGNGEEYGNGYAALDYAAQVDPEVSALVNTLARTGGRDPKIARQISQRAGVSEDVVTNYGIHLQPEYSRQMVYDRYPQLSTETRDKIGDMAYQLGDQFVTTAWQIIGKYGYGIAPIEGSGLFNQLIRGAEGGIANADVVGGNLITGALKGAGASAKDAVKGALVGTLKMPAMWMSVSSDAAFQQLRQTGYNPQAYTNGFLQGFGESFTENLFGLNGTALDDMLSTMSTSFGKNLAKNVINYALSGAEEGLEEIVNVPLGGLFEKMTVDADKPIFGEGGLFDVKEMWRSGISGAEMGLILGGVSALTAVSAARGSAINIDEQARQLNALVDAMPEAYRPAKVTPEFTDSAAVETLRASILDGYQRYYVDIAQKNQSLIQQIYHARGEDISKADATKVIQIYTDLGYGENGISAFVALAPGGEDLNSYTYAFDRVYRAGVTGQEISEVEDLLPADEAYMVYAAGIDDSASEAVRNAVQDRLPVTEGETQETTSVPSQEAVEAPTAVQTSMPSNDTAERTELRNVQEEPQKTAQNASQDNGSASLDSTDLFQFVGNVSKEGKTAISGAFEMYRQSGGEMSADSFGRSADTVYALARDLGGSPAVRGSILGGIQDKRAAIALQAVFDQGAADRAVKSAPTSRKSTGTVRAATEEELTRVKITGAKVVDLNTVDNRVSNEVKALQKIGQKLGVDFVIYESVADDNGVRSADNGLYDPSTNSVYLDVHAGIASNESMLRTAGHELTHFIQRWSPEEYDKLRQLVVDRYIGKNKALLDKRVAQKVQEYRAHGIDLSTDKAIDEMVADACEMMLRDPEAMNWISEQDKTLKDKIAEWIREFVQLIKDAFEGVTSLSREAKDMLDDMEDLQKAWNSGIQSAGERSSSAAAELTTAQKSQAESNDFGIVVQDGAAVSAPVAEIMRSPDYHPPVDPIGEAIRQSVRTRPAWSKAYLEYYGNSAEQQKVVDALNRFTDNMIMDREIMDFVPTGEYTHTTMGPIRANQEYHVTIDMDASCPRTFQFAAYRDRIQKLGSRMLTYKESINLLELMRAYGQMIPCSYCYLENKRVLLAGSYNDFFNFRQNVINAKTDAEAKKLMYSYNAKKGTLSNPAQAAMERWRTSEKDYNPTIEEVWSASATSRNSVLNYLDNLYGDDLISKNSSQKKVIDQVLRHFSVDESYKGAVTEISNFVADWFYDTIAEIPHVYQTDNDRLVKTVDQKALNLNHEALGYAKSASSARNVDKYIPYTDQIKNIPPDVKQFINAMGGIRKHSSNDFRLDYVQDYFMIFADLAAEGYFGHTYTKNIDYAKIFGRTGDRINMSIAMVDNKDGTIGMNLQEGADWNEVKSLVKNYPDVGAMAMVTSNNQLAFALNSDWITMVIPFHASSLDKAVWYNLRAWFDYTSKQNERPYNASDMKKALKSRGIPFPKNAKSQQIKEIFEAEFKPKRLYKEDGTVARPHFFPDDTVVNGQVVPGHHNDAKRYFELCREYAVHPRFDGIMIPDGNGGELNVIDHPGYVKLIKETSRTDTEQRAIQFNFGEEDPYLGMTPFEYAMQRMKEEAKNGGYGNVQQDAFGIVDEFMSEYFGKNRPIGYLTERAKNASEVMEEMREDGLKFDVSGNEVRHSVRASDEEYLRLAQDPEGNAAELQRMVDEAAKAYLETMLLPDDSDVSGFKYHRGPAPTKTFRRYAVFNVGKDGFHAAYAGNKAPTPVGVWLDAQNLQSYTSDIVQFDDGTFASYIPGDTGASTKSKFSPAKVEEYGLRGGQSWLLERGGKHSSDVPNFSQMNLKQDESGKKVSSSVDGALPHNKLIFEIEYGTSDDGNLTEYVREHGRMMKGKNQGLAKIGPNQYYDFKTNPNAVGNWGIGGTFRITRIVPYSEVVSRTNQYKEETVRDASEEYDRGIISRNDRDARIRGANAIRVQKWVGGYHPEEFGLTESAVQKMYRDGARMKLLDPVTYDDNGDVIPLSQRFNPDVEDIRYSVRNVGYHAGDLGKAEGLSSQGSYRGTGHFGTGTYFVGDPSELQYGYGNRPIEEVDFSGYSLYRPRDYKSGKRLHDALRVIDGGIDPDFLGRYLEDDIVPYSLTEAYDLAKKYRKDVRVEHDDILGDFEVSSNLQEATARGLAEFAKKYGFDVLSEEEYAKQEGMRARDDLFWDYYSDYLHDDLASQTENRRKDYSEFREAANNLSYMFGDRKTRAALKAVLEYQKGNTIAGNNFQKDSYATVFMKSLGYEGIDVRGINGLDDTRYGSVIYDLKGDALRRKHEIGTAKFSVRDTEQADLARENRSLQAKVRSLQKQLAAAKAQTKLSDREAVREADLNRLASVYIREYGLDMKRADLVEQIRGIASAVVRDPAWESAVNAAEPVARGIVSQLNGDAEDVEQAVEELRNILIEDVTNNIRYVPKTFADKKSERIDGLRGDLKERTAELRASEKEITALEKEIESIQKKSLASDMASGRELSAQRKAASEKISELSEKIKEQNREISKLERDITTMERQSLAADMADARALNEEREKSRTKISSLTSELADREKEISSLEKEITNLQRESLANDMANGREASEKLGKLRSRVEALSREIKDKNNQLRKLQSEYRALDRQDQKDLKSAMYYGRALQRMTGKYEDLKQRRASEVQKQKRAELIGKISKTVKKLDTLTRNWSDAKHVPEYLRPAVTQLVSWFTLDRVIFKSDADAVMNAYQRMLNDQDTNLSGLYDPEIAENLQNIADILSKSLNEGKHLPDFDLGTLNSIKNIVQYFDHLVTDGNKAFFKGRRENAFTISKELADQMMDRGTHTSNFLTRTQLAQFIAKGNITPYYFFKNAGGVLNDLYGDLMEGQRAYGREIIKAKKRVRQIMEKYHYDQWSEANKPSGKKKRIQFTTENGDELNVTLEEALSLYATHKRETTNVEQASNHLSKGGFVTESAVRSEKKGGKIIGIEFDDTRPIKLTFNDTVKLASMLTEEQRQYADEMVSYISRDMSDLGNDVSMKLYGYKKFLEKYYFPYETQSEYKAIRLDQPDTVSQIKNVSFSKKTVKGAASPLVIRGFTDTVLGHIAGMVNYYSEAIPQDTMMRVLNFKFRREEAEAMDTEYGTRAPRNVQTAITNAMGKESLQYITQLMRDMFNGPHNGGDILGRMLSSFKKSAVMASLSVTIQQPSSIARALALLAPKYFAKKSPTKSTWDELLRYSGTAAIKDIGSFDVSTSRSTARWLAEPDSLREQMKTGKVLDTIDDISSYGPEMMDRITWLRIWSAVKAETKAKYPNYTTEQMLTEAGKRFDEVINATQVYDSVLSKSQMMRQKDFGSKMVTSFMAEPTVAYNLLVDAFRKGQSGRYRAKALGSFVAAGVLNAILKSFVQALRKSSEKDRDYIERYAAELASNLAGAPVKVGEVRIYGVGSELSPLTMLPWIRDIIEIMQGYDVERSDISPASDVYRAVQKIVSENTTAEDVIQNVVTVVSYLTGVPAKNVYRDVEAIVRECMNPHNAEKDRTWQSVMDSITAEMGVFGSKAEQYDSIVFDWIEGNDAEKTVARLQRGGADEKTVKSGIVSAVKRAYTAGEIDASTAEEFLKRAGVDGTGTNSPAGKIASWGLDEDETIYDELFSAFDSGEDVSEMAAEIAGKYDLEEGTIYGKIRTHIKERYLNGEIDDETAEAFLVASGKDPEKTGTQSVSATVDLWSAGEDASIYDTLWTVMADGKGARAEISRLRKEYSSTDSAMKAAITSHYKEEYIASNTERRTQIRQEIYSTGLYSSATAVRDLCRGWLKK